MPDIDDQLVRRLIALQFPLWSDLPVVAVEQGGWDNRMFRLGQEMVVRLPSAACYAAQVEGAAVAPQARPVPTRCRADADLCGAARLRLRVAMVSLPMDRRHAAPRRTDY